MCLAKCTNSCWPEKLSDVATMHVCPSPSPLESGSCINSTAQKRNTKHCTGPLGVPSLGKTDNHKTKKVQELFFKEENGDQTHTPTCPQTTFLICGTHYTGFFFFSSHSLKLLTLPLSGKPLIKRKIDDQGAGLGQMLQLHGPLCHTLSLLPF